MLATSWSLFILLADIYNSLLSIMCQWEDKAAYNATLLKLASLFKKNFEVFASYQIGTDNKLTEEILAAGPN